MKINYKLATFAGGCFWCMIQPFNVHGVYEVVAGYTGGNEKNPDYEKVSSGKTGHLEAIQIKYNPKEITYEKLLELFWKQIDPTDSEGQFADRGRQYKTAIFYHDKTQKKIANNSKKELKKKFGKIATMIKKSSEFYSAEEYHQDYYKKNPISYKTYRNLSGRDEYREKVWDLGKNKR